MLVTSAGLTVTGTHTAKMLRIPAVKPTCARRVLRRRFTHATQSAEVQRTGYAAQRYSVLPTTGLSSPWPRGQIEAGWKFPVGPPSTRGGTSHTALREGSGAGPSSGILQNQRIEVDAAYVGFFGGRGGPPPTIPKPLPANSLVRSKIRGLNGLGVDGLSGFSAVPICEELALSLGSSEGVDAMLLCR
jgi:hypothetical protein